MTGDVAFRCAGNDGEEIAVLILFDDLLRAAIRFNRISRSVFGEEEMSNALGVFSPKAVDLERLVRFNGNILIDLHERDSAPFYRSALANSSGSKGRRSSTPSPMPM